MAISNELGWFWKEPLVSTQRFDQYALSVFLRKMQEKSCVKISAEYSESGQQKSAMKYFHNSVKFNRSIHGRTPVPTKPQKSEQQFQAWIISHIQIFVGEKFSTS